MTQQNLFKSCMCASGCIGQDRLAPGYRCTPERVAEYHALDFKTMERRGWERLSLRGAEKIWGHWRHIGSGREVRHCGHPTANFPYYGVDLDGKMILAPHGRGFQKLIFAQEFVETMPLPTPRPGAKVASQSTSPTQGPKGWSMPTKKKTAPKADKMLVAIGRPYVDVKTGEKVPVYFNRANNQFQATLGYDPYESATYQGLEQKLTAAYAKGARLEPAWIPAIKVYAGEPETLYFEVERELCIQKGNRVHTAKWNASPQEKAKALKEGYNGFDLGKNAKAFSLPWSEGKSWSAECYLRYDEQVYNDLVHFMEAIKGLGKQLESAIQTVNLERLFALLRGATGHFTMPAKPQKAAPAKPVAVALTPAGGKVQANTCRKCVARANGTEEPKKHSKSCPNRRGNEGTVANIERPTPTNGRQRLVGTGKERHVVTEYGTGPDYAGESQETGADVA